MFEKNLRPPSSASIGVTEPTLDLRSAIRHFCPGAPTIQVLPKPSFYRVCATIRDISTKGIGLLCHRRLEPGTVLAMPWDYGRPDRRRTLLAHVRHTAAAGERLWIMGCQFETALREDEVRAFASKAGRGKRRGVAERLP